VVLSLKLSQLPLSSESYSSSTDAPSLLVFPKNRWEKLKARTDELKAERSEQKEKFKSVKLSLVFSS